MSAKQCAKCEKSVYPVEEMKCLEKVKIKMFNLNSYFLHYHNKRHFIIFFLYNCIFDTI